MSFSLPPNCIQLVCEIRNLIDFKVNFQPNIYFFSFSLVVKSYRISLIKGFHLMM